MGFKLALLMFCGILCISVGFRSLAHRTMLEITAQSHRELELLDALRRLGGSARNADLAKTMDVSEETIRRTIKTLAKNGAVVRVHGGAYLSGTQSDQGFYRRIGTDPVEKAAIAKRTTAMIRDGMCLFMDVGSTTAFIAEELRHRSGLTVATNSVGVAQTLASQSGNRVHLLGGEMQHDQRGTFGFVTERQAQRFVFDMALLSADAVSHTRGFLFHNESEAVLTEVVAERSDHTLMALVQSKFGQTAAHGGMDAKQVSTIVTGKRPGKKLIAALDRWDVDLVLSGMGTKDSGND